MLEMVLTQGRSKAIYREFDSGEDLWDWYTSQIGPNETKRVMKEIDKWTEEVEQVERSKKSKSSKSTTRPSNTNTGPTKTKK